jgi:hypothetical protein
MPSIPPEKTPLGSRMQKLQIYFLGSSTFYDPARVCGSLMWMDHVRRVPQFVNYSRLLGHLHEIERTLQYEILPPLVMMEEYVGLDPFPEGEADGDDLHSRMEEIDRTFASILMRVAVLEQIQADTRSSEEFAFGESTATLAELVENELESDRKVLEATNQNMSK